MCHFGLLQKKKKITAALKTRVVIVLQCVCSTQPQGIHKCSPDIKLQELAWILILSELNNISKRFGNSQGVYAIV